jgi:hypothetical protein
VIKEKNKEELVRITEQGLKSKADLQMTNNRYIEFRKKMDTYNRSIQEKQGLLNGQLQQTANSKQEIEGQKNEIMEREKTIRDKDNRIY